MNRLLVRLPVLLTVLLTVLLGMNYLMWRRLEPPEWSAWWVAVPLVLTEVCAVIGVVVLAPTARRARTRDAAERPPSGAPARAVASGPGGPLHPPGTTPLAARDVKVALVRTRAALKKARRSPEATDPVVVTMLDDVEAATRRAHADLRAGTPLAELTDRWQDQVEAAARRTVSQDFDRIQSDLAVIAAIDLPAEEDMVWPEDLALAVERMSRHDLSPLASIAPLRELLDAVAVDRPGSTR